LEIPVYFLEGAYDCSCAADLARDYFHELNAPMKGFYVFGDSAHSPVLEEPEAAHRILQGDVLAGTNALADLR
jgi:pimeloyl-ACP methyl ester carboxylesterase